MSVIADGRILRAIARRYGLTFDPVHKYCTAAKSAAADLVKYPYKGEVYKLKYFDGCFYPFLIRC